MNTFSDFSNKVQNLNLSNDTSANIGYVTSVKDGVATASNLSEVFYNEILEIEISKNEFIKAVAFNLETEQVGLLILDEYSGVKSGQKVRATGKALSVDVSYSYLGRTVDSLGRPLDGMPISNERTKFETMPLEKIAPGVMTRYPVERPLKTGVMVIDSLVNVGKGQRELIIGDRQTGKTTLAIDTILNQKDQDVICIYASIGQKKSKTKQIIQKLIDTKADEYTIVVSASSSDPVALQYLAPYTAVAIGEYFMSLGRDVLVIYDDLTKHAWSYRQLSLLFRRPPGREAYPGDVFYLHSRLLERACQLNEENGGGSITALPIIETQANDISAYIPTNVISITDGQIFLESDLFNAGIRPAVNIGSSVTRVGGAAQPKNLKKVAGSLKLELAQYRELAAFSKFGGDLDKNTQDKLKRGNALTKLLIQKPNKPYQLSEEVILILAGNLGYLDEISDSQITPWTESLLKFSHKNVELIALLNSEKWSDEIKQQLISLIEDYIQSI